MLLAIAASCGYSPPKVLLSAECRDESVKFPAAPLFSISLWSSFGLERYRRKSRTTGKVGACRFVPCKAHRGGVLNQ